MITIPERLKGWMSQWKKAQEQSEADLRVALPGIINSFNSSTQTAEVKCAIKETLKVNGIPTSVQIPLLVDVPLVMPRAGNFVLTMPVAAGDECLVVFSDICIDFWWQNGGVQERRNMRRHDFSDAFAILGTWSQPRKVSSFSSSATELRSLDGNTKVSVGSGTITLSAGGHSVVISSSGVVIDGREFRGHVHAGIERGSSNSDGVV